MPDPRTVCGAVVIGRNEGERLRRCLAAVTRQLDHIVYVDSGSTDDSLALARAMGVTAIELDVDQPFTAARARNAGARALTQAHPDLAFVQFIDGDCELDPGWLAAAMAAMSQAPRIAVVCGRRRERQPDASVYNRLCDIEWNTPVGETDACGGDSLMRLSAFQQAGGFAPDLIAGEEPDLCHRLRQLGWKVWRIDAEMTLHDAGMTRPSQWWARAKRSGYATAEAWQRRGNSDPRLRRQALSNVFWAQPLAWPLWPVLWWRVYRRAGSLQATHIVLGKLPHLHGQLRYWLDRPKGQPATLIEYK
jgi:GT2 family glycosyltransferase